MMGGTKLSSHWGHDDPIKAWKMANKLFSCLELTQFVNKMMFRFRNAVKECFSFQSLNMKPIQLGPIELEINNIETDVEGVENRCIGGWASAGMLIMGLDFQIRWWSNSSLHHIVMWWCGCQHYPHYTINNNQNIGINERSFQYLLETKNCFYPFDVFYFGKLWIN